MGGIIIEATGPISGPGGNSARAPSSTTGFDNRSRLGIAFIRMSNAGFRRATRGSRSLLLVYSSAASLSGNSAHFLGLAQSEARLRAWLGPLPRGFSGHPRCAVDPAERCLLGFDERADPRRRAKHAPLRGRVFSLLLRADPAAPLDRQRRPVAAPQPQQRLLPVARHRLASYRWQPGSTASRWCRWRPQRQSILPPRSLPRLAAALVLHEDVRLRRWSAVVLGFIGVLIIMRPGSERLDINLLILLLSAATAAMNNITVKFLARSETPSRIVALFMLYLTPLSLVPALFVWQWPDFWSFGALIGLGALGTIAHLAVARALAAADASACAPFEFARLPLPP